MGKSPDGERASQRGAAGGGTEPPPAATSLVLVGSLQKPDGEQELVRVTAKVDAPLDATCIRRVRKLLEALSRTILSRDRSRWDRIDQARELLAMEDAEPEATTARTESPEAQTERRIRVPSDGAPMSAGLRVSTGPAAEVTERAEAPTRRVRIAEQSPAASGSAPEASGSSPGSAAHAPAETPAPLPPPAPKPSPWVTTSLNAPGAAPAGPVLPYPMRDRSVPMVLGSQVARLSGGPEPPGLLQSPPAGPPRAAMAPGGAASAGAPAGESTAGNAGTACFDDGRVFTVAGGSQGDAGSALPFRSATADAAAPAPAAPSATATNAPGAGSPAEPSRPLPADDSEQPTITVDSMSRASERSASPRSTARERQSEPIEQTLARLARAAGEAIEPRSDSPTSRTAPASPQAHARQQPFALPPPSAPDPAKERRAAERAGNEGATMAAPGLSPDDAPDGLAPSLAAMTVEQYALLCVETALHPHERALVHRRHQIFDEQQRAALDRRWQARLAADETLAQQWRWHYARHEQALKRPT